MTRWIRRGLFALMAFLVLGNAAIIGSTFLARGMVKTLGVTGVPGVDNLRVVDDKVWRGAAPSAAGYAALAAAGVTDVVDLRAEDGVAADRRVAASFGLHVVAMPIRDGQLPSHDQVQRFFAVVAEAPGKVFVHCGAGVGRTGAMAVAYLVGTEQATGRGAVLRNLEVGPPSLEQVLFAVDGARNPLVTAGSRVLDAPRRLWHNLT